MQNWGSFSLCTEVCVNWPTLMLRLIDMNAPVSSVKISVQIAFILALLFIPSLLFSQTTTSTCHNWTINLKLGDRGTDVSELQKHLLSHGFDIPGISKRGIAPGYYGGETQAAVKNYQTSKSIRVTGTVGPLTRAALIQECNSTSSTGNTTIKEEDPGVIGTAIQEITRFIYDKSSNKNPTVYAVSGPTTLFVDQMGTWSVNAVDPEKQTLNYSVDWGARKACPDGYICKTPVAASIFVTSPIFSNAYTSPGTYTVTFSVQDSGGAVTHSSSIVEVKAK